MGEKTGITNVHLRGCMREINQRHISYPICTYRRSINRLWCLFSVAASRIHHWRFIINWLSSND